MKTLIKQDIFDILDREIKKEMLFKNEYIKKNGYKHKDTLNAFDTSIATLTRLYGTFETVFKEN